MNPRGTDQPGSPAGPRRERREERIHALGNLAGSIVHDLSNYLTTIVSNGEILRDRLPSESEDAILVAQMVDAAEEAVSLTNHVRGFIRGEVPVTPSIDLNEVISRFRSLIQWMLGDRNRLITELGPNLLPVASNPIRIQQVLMNLCGNARDAMPGGGLVTIRTANLVLEDTRVQSRVHIDGKPYGVCLEVADEGFGISPEIAGRIFDRYFTTKGAAGGTGVGLATVQDIVEEAGGVITVDSRPGHGTTFRMIFPAVEAVAESVHEVTKVPAKDRGATVMVVENDDVLRGTLCRALRQDGYHVVEARDGEQALELGRYTHRLLDLLVTDIVMPGMDGGRLASRMQKRRPGLRVLFISGYGLEPDVRRIVKARDASFLEKPFRVQELLDRIASLLVKERSQGA